MTTSLTNRYLAEKDMHYERLEETRVAFLEHANALCASCIYFEGAIENKQQTYEAMRISLDAWASSKAIEHFVKLRLPYFKKADYDLAGQWRDFLHGPMYCMETDGQKALFMCEGHVFEVVSFGRSWDEMVPFAPDLVLATLLPYDGIIVSDGLIMHHSCAAEGPGVVRVQNEFKRGIDRGIVRDADQFALRAREINELHERVGWDPTSYYALCQYVEEINEKTFPTCFSYKVVARLRSWDAA